MNRFVVIASNESNYVRRVVRRLCERGNAPRVVLLGSKVQRIYFKIQSLRRIKSQIGLKEALARLRRSRTTSANIPGEPSISELRAKHDLDVRTFDAMNSGAILVALLEHPDTIAILAGAGIADRATIAAVKGKCINAHPALLPGMRGVDVLEWALVRRKPLGVSAHLVVPSVDAGDILKTKGITPEVGETFERFSARLQELQADVLADAAIEFAAGKIAPVPHDLTQSELCLVAPAAIKQQARNMFHSLTEAGPNDSSKSRAAATP